MDNVKNDQYYVKKIMEFINFAISHLDSISCQQFESNDVLQNAIMFTFIQISENTNKLSDEFKTNHSNIPWNQIRGLRNIIVHNYEIVDGYIVYDTVKNGLPEFKELLLSI